MTHQKDLIPLKFQNIYCKSVDINDVLNDADVGNLCICGSKTWIFVRQDIYLKMTRVFNEFVLNSCQIGRVPVAKDHELASFFVGTTEQLRTGLQVLRLVLVIDIKRGNLVDPD